MPPIRVAVSVHVVEDLSAEPPAAMLASRESATESIYNSSYSIRLVYRDEEWQNNQHSKPPPSDRIVIDRVPECVRDILLDPTWGECTARCDGLRESFARLDMCILGAKHRLGDSVLIRDRGTNRTLRIPLLRKVRKDTEAPTAIRLDSRNSRRCSFDVVSLGLEASRIERVVASDEDINVMYKNWTGSNRHNLIVSTSINSKARIGRLTIYFERDMEPCSVFIIID